ncbi:rifin PIR protein, putative [Plasmodium reichenowi]|uniref:Rifin PIR protein, putative n=1 Tax=Plasmodium reichenowi TaxID=5854 RepID=A0A2P9DSK2_PLARE|nr:rifin PIR protein, putative [Plasmodium reichenowi]
MKLHYYKILLYVIPLNILVTSSSYVHNNKNKPSITPYHTPIYTSRVLSECDIQSSIYDKDADMKSVKEKFDRQTSQRFEEYGERLQEKRQKRKEERDKNIQKIIEKDKMEKSLTQKIENGCLRCGCGLGGVAASVGLFGGLGTYGWKTDAIAAVEKAAAAKGAEAGMNILINKLKIELVLKELYLDSLVKAITTKNYLNETLIFERVKEQYQACFSTESACGNKLMLNHYGSGGEGKGFETAVQDAKRIVQEGVNKASKATTECTESQMATVQADELKNIAATSTYSYNTIGYSVLSILIIVLIMVIIYLVLRYRRKKKMKKKAQYTKLLNE